MKQQYHVPIMLDECVKYLNVKPDGVYFDGTLGGGGHSEAILQRLTSGRLIAVDRDSEAILFAGERLQEYRDKLSIVHDVYENAARIIDNKRTKLDGAILDLGISSHHIDAAARGFSYMKDANLDMRMDQTQYLTAFNVVNEYAEDELARIIREYGEDSNASRIAAAIVKTRKTVSIRTTLQLARIIEDAVKNQRGGHLAKKAFQAIRIEVNGELSGIKSTITDIVDRLNPQGRLVILSFHSLEDRIVKETFAELAAGCICDKKLPVCVCKHEPSVKILAKAQTASQQEVEENPRSASAKLRAIEKI